MKRTLAVVVLVLVSLGLGVTSASAHAILVSSSPADGEQFQTAPAAITLTFDEDILVDTAIVTVSSGEGTIVARSGPAVQNLNSTGEPGAADGSTVLVVALPQLATGAFAVSWQVQSADDLHRTDGSIVFGVGQPVSVPAADRSGALPSAASTALHWADLTALSLMLGALLLGLVVVPRSALSARNRRYWQSGLRSVVRWSATAGLILAVAVLLDSAGGITRIYHIVRATPFGNLWLVHVAGLVGVLVVSRRSLDSSARRLLAVLAALAAVCGLAAGSHVGVGGDRPVAAALLAAHLAAGCGWAGAVVLLFAVGLPSRFRRQALDVARAFGAPAAVCVAVVATTGLAVGARQVASADALISSNYGLILLVKLGLVGLAGVSGLVTFVRLRRPDPLPAGHLSDPSRIGRVWHTAAVGQVDTITAPTIPMDGPKVVGRHRKVMFVRSTAVEGLFLLLVLGAAAALSLSTAPLGPAFAPTVQSAQPRLAAQVDDLVLTLDFSPGTLGQNWARVTVDDTRRPAPAPISNVSLAPSGLDGQQLPERPLTQVAGTNGWRLDDVRFAAAGSWQAELTVQRAGRPPVVWTQEWVVGGGPLGSQRPVLSDQPWAGLLNGLAVALALAFAVIAAVVGWWRRRDDAAPSPAEETSAEEEKTAKELVRP